MTQAEQLLHDLAHALNNAYISTWQTTAAWQKQLDAALEYLNERKQPTMTTQPEALKTLDMMNKFKVIGMLQYRTLREFILQSEESDFFATTVDEVANIVADTPDMYSQDGAGEKAIVHLHYFNGNYDAWITELNLGTRIAFGKASFSGATDAEYGYISLQELFDNNVELDLYWTPKPIGEIK